jgi:ABC-type transport system involved in multi-copper enzyme maturation permease subunit
MNQTKVDFWTAVEMALRATTLEWGITLGVLALLVAAVLAFCYTTQAGIIARATTKEAVRQPVFWLLMALAIVFLAINWALPYFTLGEDLKMFKDVGLVTILFCSMFLGVWTASTGVADEIEGRTAMTLLSKPITRRQFIVGKYVGIVNSIALLAVPMILVFLVLIYFKVGYDVREGSTRLGAGDAAVGIEQILQVMPGLLLMFLEAAVITAISVAIATRLPMIVNAVICLTIFIVGHLTPVLVRTVLEDFEPVQFVAQLIATVLPSLEMFKTDTVIATGRIIPPEYLGVAALYGAAYSAAALLLAFILFEDRDLA